VASGCFPNNILEVISKHNLETYGTPGCSIKRHLFENNIGFSKVQEYSFSGYFFFKDSTSIFWLDNFSLKNAVQIACTDDWVIGITQ